MDDDEQESETDEPREQPAPAPRWRPAAEPACCGSGCHDCPF